MRTALTNREADLMQVLWKHGPCLVAEVRTHLQDDLAYTTVLSLLRTLEMKDFVRRTREGRSHRYAARVQQQVARRNALRHLTEKLFEGSPELLVAQLVADDRLTPQQIDRMRLLLGERAREAA
jgi:BlaI family transcriptional regulator, penicillinase repressor